PAANALVASAEPPRAKAIARTAMLLLNTNLVVITNFLSSAAVLTKRRTDPASRTGLRWASWDRSAGRYGGLETIARWRSCAFVQLGLQGVVASRLVKSAGSLGMRAADRPQKITFADMRDMGVRGLTAPQ